MPYIRLDQIEFSIGTQILLDKVSLTLDKGERLGLLGRNGAGKSTLIKIMLGLVLHSDGTVRVFGAHVAKHGVGLRGMPFNSPDRPTYSMPFSPGVTPSRSGM